MVLMAVKQANISFQNLGFSHRFKEEFSDDAYEIMWAKKNGNPNEDYPSKNCSIYILDFEINQLIKSANVKLNRFSVVYQQSSVLFPTI